MENKELDFYLNKLRRENSINSNFFDEEAERTLLNRGFAEKVNFQGNISYDLAITNQGRSFEGFIKEEDNLKKERKRDELNERSVKSAEASAEAAKESAKAANRANGISIWAIIISLISFIVSLLFKMI